MSGVEIFFVVAATIVFGFLFCMWKRDGWFNMILKIILFVMTITGVLIIYDKHIIF